MNTFLRRLAGILLLALVLAGCSKQPPSEPLRNAADDTLPEHAVKHTNPRYRCPMHPDIVRDAPGECPICGMTLVKVEPPAGEVGTDNAPADAEVRISPAVMNNLGVRTEPVVRGSLPRRSEVVGYVQFDERTVQQVRPRAEGWVEGLSVRAMGETVQAGQLLFTLYSPMLESVQQEYLDALKIGNRDLIDASRDRLRAVGLDAGTAARLAKSGRAAGRVPFHAPISGVITELEAREGAMLTPAMSAMTITELGSLWVVAEVPESQSAWVRQGTHAEVRFSSQPGAMVHGRVEYVYPELNMETRTVRARIMLDAPPQDVRPNMLATVSLMAADSAAVLHIPRSAVIRNGTRDRVVIALGDGRFASRNVVAGAEGGDRITIREGLQEGDRVVVAAQFLLDSEANLGAGLDRLDDGSTAPAAAAQADPHAAH
ncbi:MAG: efflux RND transporter periplasmic adaptor subunit [Steroidobacteraceae bacterium]|jgi:Cu(I)/Ag(I) efflux system membrane fusion protein|nr:efflux RND transporter periplasmic adaptor subunit [Steroidobacteraceae bacterium]MBP9128769.1 efflux RND transporter periplasmic adaptor subunit [Steroidobacteraceae bacterium]